jgi:hypothetical protein
LGEEKPPQVWDEIVTAPTDAARSARNLPNESNALQKDSRISQLLFRPKPLRPHNAAHDQGTTPRKMEWNPFADPSLDGGAAARGCDALVGRRRNLPDEPQPPCA